MAVFKIAYDKTAKNEGGYTNVHDDNGNWTGGKVGVGVLVGTNHGISAPILMKYLGKVPTINEMKTLSIDIVKNIYKKNYWDVVRGDEIIIQEVANSIYDSAVNMGCKRAIILAQSALGIENGSGIMDSNTLGLLNNKKIV